MAGSDVGYLMIAAESYFASTADPAQDLAAAKEDLARAVAALRDKHSLVIDMRFNLGGDDRVALELAGWIANRAAAGFGKCARDGSGHTPLHSRVPFSIARVQSTGIDAGLEKALHLLRGVRAGAVQFNRFKRSASRGRRSPCVAPVTPGRLVHIAVGSPEGVQP